MTSHVLASVLKSKFRQYSKLLFERKEPLPICKRVSLKKEAGARLKRSQIILSVIIWIKVKRVVVQFTILTADLAS